jgi:hypothetical protein
VPGEEALALAQDVQHPGIQALAIGALGQRIIQAIQQKIEGGLVGPSVVS